MNRRASNAWTLLPALAIGLAVSFSGKTHGENAQVSSSSTSLDQVSAENVGQSKGQVRSSDVDVPQPYRPSQPAAVMPSEISDRSDSRSLSMTQATGSDRCDGSVANARVNSALCGRPIEGRANQFSRPSSVGVSPEAKLLLLTNPRTTGVNGSPASAFDGPNGRAEQLAGALRDGVANQDLLVPKQNTPVSPGMPPSGVLPIIVNPPK